uniref:Uncharacterized protein n=1 Tax=Romanomermis culicivorax TaxID=13658 RepID=A0A915KJX2_ROMCU
MASETSPLKKTNSHKSTVVYNTRTRKVEVYDDSHDEGKVFLPEEQKSSDSDDTWQRRIAGTLKSKNQFLRLFLAEFLGTFVLIAFGVGCVAQVVLNKNNFRFGIVPINLGWGLAVSFGVYACGGMSHGHINPAATIAFAIFGRLKWRFVPVYLLGQYLGAFFGALAVYCVYHDQINFVEQGNRENATTSHIFATYPQGDHISTFQGFVDQVFATGLLILLAMAVTDERNMQVSKGLAPLIIGLGVTALTTAYESNCGAALNPARDFSPRLFTAMFGWGSRVFSYRNYNWFWVPILGPHIGAILGGWLYNICVGLHLDPIDKKICVKM